MTEVPRRSAGPADGDEETQSPRRQAKASREAKRNDAIREIYAFLEAVLTGKRSLNELWRVLAYVRGPVRSGFVAEYIAIASRDPDTAEGILNAVRELAKLPEEDRIGRNNAIAVVINGALPIDEHGQPVIVARLQAENQRLRDEIQGLQAGQGNLWQPPPPTPTPTPEPEPEPIFAAPPEQLEDGQGETEVYQPLRPPLDPQVAPVEQDGQTHEVPGDSREETVGQRGLPAETAPQPRQQRRVTVKGALSRINDLLKEKEK